MNDVPVPFRHEGRVLADWIDYNGHMNVAFYVMAFDRAVDEVYDALDLGRAYAAREGRSMFAVGLDIDYLRELHRDEAYRIDTRILDLDDKRLLYHQEMVRTADGVLAARATWLALHVDLESRRAVPFPAAKAALLRDVVLCHAVLPRPADLGRRLAVKRPFLGPPAS